MLENKLSNLSNDELKELIRILEIKNKKLELENLKKQTLIIMEKQKKIEKDQKLWNKKILILMVLEILIKYMKT